MKARLENFKIPRVVIFSIVVAVLGTVTVFFSSAGSPPKTYYVSNSGADTNIGSQAAPFLTITKAATLATSGDTVIVNSGVYHEQVDLLPINSGVIFQGAGQTKPIIDGDNVRSKGITLGNGANNITIDGFEVRNIVNGSASFAAGIYSTNSYNIVIKNNDVHDVHSSNNYSYGIYLGHNGFPGRVHDINVQNNKIYSIGPGGESMGIWLLYTTGINLDGNEIYLVRKEGIRDWGGLQNNIINNRVYLTFVGIEAQGSMGSYIANNFSYDNVYNYNLKHVSETEKLAAWNLSVGQWTKFWHNTSYNATHADITTGMNPPDADYIDIRNNLFASPGDVHVHDFPNVRGANIIVNGNAYSGAAPLSYINWTANHSPVYSDLASLRAGMGWEQNGQMFTPQFINTITGNLGFNTSGLAPGVALPDSYGTQVGARLTGSAHNSWTSYPVTVIDSSALTNNLNKQRASDGHEDTYWWSTTNTGWLTMDLGSSKSMNTFVLDIYSHQDNRAPKSISIQTSNDNVNYSDTHVTVNPDNYGSSYKYSLSSPINARYVKLNLLSNFGAGTVIFPEFKIGLLKANDASPSIDVTAPAVSLGSLPSPASSNVTVSATASDNVGVTGVQFQLDGEDLGDEVTTPTGGSYSVSWDTTVATNGVHVLTAIARDAAGNTTLSSSQNVTVLNIVAPILDIILPTISLTSPANTNSLADTVKVKASASDNVGVTGVELYIDGTLVATDVAAPYVFNWDTTEYSNGNHTVVLKAKDAASNERSTSTTTYTVANETSVEKSGDVNDDGEINIFDLALIGRNWGLSGRTRLQGDLSGDGTVNIFDLAILGRNWGA